MTLLARPPAGLLRSQFVARMSALLGGQIVGGFLPLPTDTTTSVCPWTGKVWTADAAMTLTQRGKGTSRAFVSGSSNYLTTPDVANLSFNASGLTDLPFTLLVLANVTDTAAARSLISKWGPTASAREWILFVDAADLLTLTVRDESAAVNVTRASNAAITQGSWALLAMAYDGTGGATAMNGAALYQNGAAIASTAGNNASYVAMEDKAAPGEIGSNDAHTASFLDGSTALVVVAQFNASAGVHASAAALCRPFFGVTL